jgi:AcrR family transcriptional regulator
MAWDTDRTKQLLLDAATQEFSRYGLAGARVDRIATSAGVNKERIYQYFGKKDELFGIVLEKELTAVMDVVSITGSGIAAITSYAGRIFDYQRDHPALARLIFWEGLELDSPVAEEFRTQRNVVKTEKLREALPELSLDDAHELLLTCLTLADGWQVLGNADRIMTGEPERDDARHARRRAHFVRTMEAIARDLISRA